MARYLQTLLPALAMATSVGTAQADDAVLTARVGTTQGGSAGITAVVGKPFCFLFSCSGSAGMALDAEVGLGGVKAGLGLGVADRQGGVGLLALKAVVLRAWNNGPILPDASLYAGPELDVAGKWGGSLAAYKRVDGPGWRLSIAILRTF